MKRGATGRYLTLTDTGGEEVRAFLPSPLPPVPALQIDGELRERLDRALVSLGRLDSVTTLLPDTQLFLYTYVRKEAVLSSQIEGTKSTLSDLLLYERSRRLAFRWTTSPRCRATSPLSSMASSASLADSHSRTA
jgi:hypothetical protein